MRIILATEGEDRELTLDAARKFIPGAEFEVEVIDPSEVESWAKGRNGRFIKSLDEARSVDVPILRESDIPEGCWQ